MAHDSPPDALPPASSKARVCCDVRRMLMLTQPPQELYARKFEASDLRRAFEKLDVRRDGIIDVHELRHVLQGLGYHLSKVV